MSWTRFTDMCSGGGLKEKYGYIYIEAPLEEAKRIFYNRFGHNPERVSCTCCGEDYRISEAPTIEEATADERDGGVLGGVLFIDAKDIKPEERSGEVPEQDYVEGLR